MSCSAWETWLQLPSTGTGHLDLGVRVFTACQVPPAQPSVGRALAPPCHSAPHRKSQTNGLVPILPPLLRPLSRLSHRHPTRVGNDTRAPSILTLRPWPPTFPVTTVCQTVDDCPTWLVSTPMSTTTCPGPTGTTTASTSVSCEPFYPSVSLVDTVAWRG